MKRHLLATALLLTLNLPIVSHAANDVKTLAGLYNARYCEVIIAQRHLNKVTANVYSTIHLNNCPADAWNKLNADDIKKQYNAVMVKLNGPRYFLMNSLVASKNTINTPVISLGGIQFQQRAQITASILGGGGGDKLYTPHKVSRNTIWVYNPGTTIYELISPQNDVYVMQSYAQIVDPKLQLSDLATVGSKLKLPTGWKFQTQTLTQPLQLKADGVAYVINDDLLNTYQKQ